MAERHGDPAWVDFWERVEQERERRSESDALIRAGGVTLDSDLGWVPADDLTPEGESAYLRFTAHQQNSTREGILARRHEREVRELKARYTELQARFGVLLVAFGLITVPLFIAWNW